jgi:hypothetical protein
MFVDNMNRRDAGWEVGDYVDGKEVLISYDHDYCIDALEKMASELSTEYYFDGKVVSLGKLERNKDNPLALSYGKGNGFKTGVSRSNTNEQPPTEILFVEGGSDNIDRSKYPPLEEEAVRAASSGDLLLPRNAQLQYDGEYFEDEEGFDADSARTYISDDLGLSIRRLDKEISSAAEDSIDCSSIYPKRVCSVSEVVAVDVDNNFYDIIDPTIPASLDFNDYIIGDNNMTIVFQSGMLASREFEVKYIHNETSVRGETKKARRFEIVPQEYDGITMPGDCFLPAEGDEFAVFNVMLPQAYINAYSEESPVKEGAEWEMFRAAVKHLYDAEEQHFTFSGTLDGLWAKKDWDNIGGRIVLGGYVLFSDKNFERQGVRVRIVGIKDYINNPHSPEIELSNSTISTSVSTTLKELAAEEVLIEANHQSALQFTRRRFRDAKETMSMLSAALLSNFTEGISPITVQTMQMLVGDESLQFRFVDSVEDPHEVAYNITYDSEKKTLSFPEGLLQHLTLGINTLSSDHTADEYLYWYMPATETAELTDGSAKYYVYAKVQIYDKTKQARGIGAFFLSETPKAIDSEEGAYYLLVGILNSEYEGDRSFAPLYGYTEILPGRITTDSIVSSGGDSYFDMKNNAMKLGDRMKFNEDGTGQLVLQGTMVQSSSGATAPLPCYRGIYNSSYTYFAGDTVVFAIDGLFSLYQCVQQCSGIDPTHSLYWAIQASAGTPGGPGENGLGTCIAYCYALTQPKTPTDTSIVPAGWADTPDRESFEVEHSGDWTLKEGYYVSSAVEDDQMTTQRMTFATTKPNQRIFIEARVSSEAKFDFLLLGRLDTDGLSRTENYAERISGADVSAVWVVDIPTAGSHFIDIAYAKDASTAANGDFGKYRIIVVDRCWLTFGAINTEGAVFAWTEPQQFAADTKVEERVYLRMYGDSEPPTPSSDAYVDDFIPEVTAEEYDSSKTYNTGDLCTGADAFIYYATKDGVTTQPVTQLTLTTLTGSTITYKKNAGWALFSFSWTDNPQAVSASARYQFEAVRRKENGVWGDFHKPTLWNNYALDGKQGEAGASGSYYEFRYQLSGDPANGPDVSETEREPSGWDTKMPSEVGLGYYIWMIVAKISGVDKTKLLENWTKPIRVSGQTGESGKSPALVYRGQWDSSKQYYGNEYRLDCVRYTDGAYYIAQITAGLIPIGTLPTDTGSWNPFGASFDSVATELLLAEFAYIDNLGVRDLMTAKSGKRVHISQEQNALTAYDADDIASVVVAGETLSDDKLFGGAVKEVAPTDYVGVGAGTSNQTKTYPAKDLGSFTFENEGVFSGSIAIQLGAVFTQGTLTDEQKAQPSLEGRVRLRIYLDSTIEIASVEIARTEVGATFATYNDSVAFNKPITAGEHSLSAVLTINCPRLGSDGSMSVSAKANWVDCKATSEIRMSRYFANGNAVGCGSKQYAETIMENGKLLHKVEAGAVGISFNDGQLKLKLGGSWYTASVIGQFISLTATGEIDD